MLELGSNDLTKVLNPHRNLWFRGHTDADWILVPMVYRLGFADGEKDRLQNERFLNQEFRVRSAGIRVGAEDNEELYFLQQHYGMPTRLLDWSTSPLAALFFAVSDEGGSRSNGKSRKEKNGKLFAMDARGLARTQIEKAILPDEESFRGIATSRNPTFQNALKQITGWPKDSIFPKIIFPVRPDHFDRRISLQQSCFTFHVPEPFELTEKENSSLREFVIPADKKPKIKAELETLGVNDFTIFGDLDHLAKWLKYAYRIAM